MFERFTSGARTVVELAHAEAQALRHGQVGTEHLLLGLLLEEHGIAARALRAAGVTAPAVRDGVERLLADSRLSRPDADALRAIGIDVDRVRARVDESFGPGVLDRALAGGRRPGASRCQNPMSPRAKKVLELSLREALHLRHNHIGTEHILLGLLREGRGLGAQILAEAGVGAGELRRSVLAAVGKVA